jgi:type III pantothenate kinase
MILVIDAGNSRVKWGWYEPQAGGKGAWSSIANVSLIEFAATSDHINPFSATHENPARILVSNVAGDGAQQLIVNWTSIFDVLPEWVHGASELCGVKSRYEHPELLGPDRWAALIAARALEPGRDCLVVNAGTCTTVDVLTAGGEFTGGLILPGVDLMRYVLHEHTGRLPLQEGRFVSTPRNTLDAIESGCRHAQAGAIERMHRKTGGGALCLVSGGGGPALIERLQADGADLPCRYVENLVLEGLARMGSA